MRRLEDPSAIAWLRDELAPLPQGGESEFRVEHRLPKRLQAAAKILHPIFIDPDISDRRLTWNESGAAEGKRGERLLWRDLADELGLAVCPELTEWSFLSRLSRGWPRYLVGPDEGSLPDEQCRRLADCLRPLGDDPMCFFYYDLAATTDWEAEQLWQGRLSEIDVLLESDEVWCSPTVWIPEDRSWCVSTDYDLTFTLVGGPGELIAALERDPLLETLRVDFETRIDPRADTINRAKPKDPDAGLVSFGE